MKIDGHLFPANMVDVRKKRNVLQTKVLTSQSAKESGAVDPKALITVNEAKSKEPQHKEEFAAPKKKVTSQMLLNKFQRDQERRQYMEESVRRHEGHWRCPFFVYCWEEGLTLPTVDNCLECNGFYREDRSHKKPRFDQRPRGPIIRGRGDDRHISMHDRLGGRVSVHDRLGSRTMLRDPVGERISAEERVGRTADDRISDEYPHCRDLERERESVHDNTDRPRWCLAGLTRS
jgi:hypothetical protein